MVVRKLGMRRLGRQLLSSCRCRDTPAIKKGGLLVSNDHRELHKFVAPTPVRDCETLFCAFPNRATDLVVVVLLACSALCIAS